MYISEKFKRVLAGGLASFMLCSTALTITGCSTNYRKNDKVNSYSESNDDVLDTRNRLIEKFPNINKDKIENFNIILLLDLIAKADENGKISTDIIKKYKKDIDSDAMMSDFYSVLDVLEYSMIEENCIITMSDILPSELKNDAVILSKIESITSNILNLVNNGASKEEIQGESSKIYKLFVSEEDIEMDGITFNVRDLCLSNRAIANSYARTAAYYARDYITEEERNAIDSRTNDQNNKAYIKSTLEILSNNLPVSESETNIEQLFNNKYSDIANYLDGKVNFNSNDLINYLNIKYLDSDKVSYKDKSTILGEYDEDNMNNAIVGIDAITSYNLSNQNSMIIFSNFLVDNYLNTNAGAIDKVALDFVQYNSIMLSNTVFSDADFNTLNSNPYFQNIYKYLTKQDFTHSYPDGKEYNIVWQDISDGTNLICNEVINYTLDRYKNISYVDGYTKKSHENLRESIQYVQNVVNGECKRVNDRQYVKSN